MTSRTPSYLLLAFLSIVLPVSSQTREHYALVLQDAPVASRFLTREATRTPQADTYRAQIESRQAALKSELASRNFNVVGSVSTLANAVFVVSTSSRVAEMRSLAGVTDVIQMRKLHPTVNKATQLMNAPAAWTALGGVSNAGKGIKIGIIDSGIDQTHPAFQDSTLTPPAGFPKCTTGQPQDCSYTNSKVIVAKSYIRQQSAGSNPSNVAADSLPDDYSPRDRLGHGTGTASVAAGSVNTGPAVTFNGMAPKAFLGNYKVLGTGFEGSLTAFEDATVQALEDAFNDGMDVVSCSLGIIAVTPASQDFMAAAFEKAAEGGLVIAVSAGNDGANGQQFPSPTFNTMSSPATAPSVIAVGATINSHIFQPSVSVPGASANLQNISAQSSDANYFYESIGATSAPLIDVQNLGNDGYACTALPAFSLLNAVALIQRSPTSSASACTFNVKATNAANAGAIGIVFYMADSSATFPPTVLDDNGNPFITGGVVMISQSDGLNLKSYIDAHSGAAVLIDPNGTEQDLTSYSTYWQYSPALVANQLASYSSSGPGPGMSLKPDIVATGGFDGNVEALNNAGMYVATQSYDPGGEIYSPNGYVAADGTSFAAPLVAGAAALVKQAHPTFTAAQIRSALINTSSQDTNVDDQGYQRNVTSFGAGRLDANAALSSTVTVTPVSISFGVLSGSLPAATPVTITNGGSASVTLTIAAVAPVALAGTAVTGITVNVDQKSLTVPAGGTATFNVSLAGAIPIVSSQYSGNITVQGTGVSLHIPYLFIVSSNVVYDMFGIIDGSIFNPNNYACFEGLPGTDLGQDQRLMIKLIDANGAPVAGTAVKFAISPRNNITLSSVGGMPACTPSSSGSQVSCSTDSNGVAYAEVTTGTTIGAAPVVDATISGFDFEFGGCNAVIAQPNITGIADAAVGATTVAPGSYISIYGSNLVDPAAIQGLTQFGDGATYVPFPLNLDGVSVSFDVPGAYDGTPADYNGAPGHIVFVASSAGQINLQVPWELQGASSVQVKVNVDGLANSNVVTLPLAQYAPTIFQASGIVAAVDATTGTIVTAANPAHAGDVVELYANGLGPVNNQPASGDPSPVVLPLATTKTPPTVTIGGQTAVVSFSGLAPGNPGLYQINVTVPSVAAGNQTVALSIGGVSAPTAVIPIK